MTIHRNDPRWTAYVLNEMDVAQRSAFEREMTEDPEAEHMLSEIRETVLLLEDALSAVPQGALSRAQRQEIHEATAAATAERRFPWTTISGIAAVLLIGLVSLMTLPNLIQSPGSTDTATIDPANEAYPETPAPEPVVQVAQTLTRGESNTDAVSEVRRADPDEDADPEVPTGSQTEPGEPAFRGVVGGAIDTFDDVGETGKAGADPSVAVSVQNLASTAESEDFERQIGTSRAQVRPLEEIGQIGGALLPAGARTTRSPAAAVPPPPPPPPSTVGIRADATGRTRFNTEAYDRIVDNAFVAVSEDPLATFSADVDTASYANVRRFLNQRTLPPPDAVRIEEMVNYFPYDYPPPQGDRPLRVHAEVAAAPWAPRHRLVRIGIKGQEIDLDDRARTNLVFLIDVSGSMSDQNKLPLLKDGMKLLVEQLGENDRVAIVVYAGASGVVLPSTTGNRPRRILASLDRLSAGGSTNGGAGIELAYDIALEHFVEGGVNRVILATDGDFNVGVTNNGELTRLIEQKARSGVFLSVLGFGTGNYNDAALEALADQGNGNYAYIDGIREARKVLVEQLGSTLVTIAKDVKFQVEFNPAEVRAYRLIGYENRSLEDQDFTDDTKDAGEIGAGHAVTALFEVVPTGVEIDLPGVAPLRYQTAPEPTDRSDSGELLTVGIRYKDPDGDESRLIEVPVVDDQRRIATPSVDYRFQSAVAAFGMLLRDSPYKGSATFDSVIEAAETSLGGDREGYRAEFVELVRRARAIQDLGQ